MRRCESGVGDTAQQLLHAGRPLSCHSERVLSPLGTAWQAEPQSHGSRWKSVASGSSEGERPPPPGRGGPSPVLPTLVCPTPAGTTASHCCRGQSLTLLVFLTSGVYPPRFLHRVAIARRGVEPMAPGPPMVQRVVKVKRKWIPAVNTRGKPGRDLQQAGGRSPDSREWPLTRVLQEEGEEEAGEAFHKE